MAPAMLSASSSEQAQQGQPQEACWEVIQEMDDGIDILRDSNSIKPRFKARQGKIGSASHATSKKALKELKHRLASSRAAKQSTAGRGNRHRRPVQDYKLPANIARALIAKIDRLTGLLLQAESGGAASPAVEPAAARPAHHHHSRKRRRASQK